MNKPRLAVNKLQASILTHKKHSKESKMNHYNVKDDHTKACRQKILSALVCSFVFIVLVTLLPSALVSASSGKMSNMPMAGSTIVNQATAWYYHTRLGGVESISSNTTTVNVMPVRGFKLENDRQQHSTQGNWVVMSHRLTNTGNIESLFEMYCENGDNDEYNLLGLVIYIDTNSNGVIDGADIKYEVGEQYMLSPNASLDLLLTGQVPTTSTKGMYAEAYLAAFIPETELMSSIMDTVWVENGAVLRFFKKSNQEERKPGEIIEYQLIGTNVGNASMDPFEVIIDDSSDRRVLIRDNIPLSTQFESILEAGTSQVLYHLAGTGEHVYQTKQPSNKGMIDAVVFAYQQIPAGYSFDVKFSVKVNENGGNDINNIATSYFNTLDETFVVDSNKVVVEQPPAPAEIDFMNSAFTGTQEIINAGDMLYLKVEAAACNLDASVAESYPIDLRSQLSGDLERGFYITETGPNTGTFVVKEIPTLAWPENEQVDNNFNVEVTRNDFLTARWDTCPGVLLETRLLVDPAGIVFDSRNNQPVANAQVVLQGINPDGSVYVPEVFDSEMNLINNDSMTDANGYYEFPVVPEGEYRLLVISPDGHQFTSTFMPEDLSPERRIDDYASYFGMFTMNGVAGPIYYDIPLDPAGLTGLFIEKSVSRNVAAVGETVLYTVKVTNNTIYDLFDVNIDDFLPDGFIYMPGTSLQNGELIADPTITDGSHMQYNVSWFVRDTSITFTYRTQIRNSALRGDGINRVRAINDNAESNVGVAQVKVEDDVFSDEAFIIGKVYMDCNRDRMQGIEELGIPGVRLYLQDGSYVVSDVEGKYSFAGLQAKTHVLSIDKTTLPNNAEMVNLSSRNAGDAYSNFVDVKRGELFRADFAEGSCTKTMLGEVKERRAQGAVRVAEVEERLKINLKTDPETTISDRRSLPSSGIVSGESQMTGFKSLNKKATLPTKSLIPSSAPAKGDSVDLGELIKGLDATLGFIDLKDNDTLASSQLSIRVKGVAGAALQLSVNGEVQDANRIGQKVVMSSTGVEAWEYIAVRLQPGKNELKLAQLDQFDNQRGEKIIQVSAPGSLGRLVISSEIDGSPADGHTPVVLAVSLKDDKDLPVSARTAVTLESTLGVWDVEDLDPKESGIQTFIEGGTAQFELLPPDMPGESLIRVSSGITESTFELDFLPDLRPLMVSGILEGAVGMRTLGSDEVTPASKNDGFEETIGSFNFSGGDKLEKGARAALFLKGKILGEHLLTLSYDSDRDENTRLFRDIRPDEFYPVYGDSSVKGFEAQSTSKLFVRVDKGRSYLQYGDFSTNTNNEARRLSNFNRTFNGLQGHLQTSKVEVNVFASYDYTSQVVREFQGKGISGPYPLDNRNMVRQSEIVEILVRDREQPSLVLSTKTLTRFVDYSLDFFSGDLVFRQPIASIDADFNPVYIRVSFEVDSDQKTHWVYGADGQFQVTDQVEVGISHITDENPENNYQLSGANTTLKVTDNDTLIVEYAHSKTDIEGEGYAARLEWKHRSKKLDSRIYAVRSEEDFINPNASVRSGHDEAGAQLSYRINKKNRLESELRFTEDVITEDKRQGGKLSLQSQLIDSVSLELGMRYVESSTVAKSDNEKSSSRALTSGLAKITWQPESMPEASMFTEYEQDLADSDSNRAQLGGEYQVSNRGRVYARHELISSSSGEYGLDASARNNSTQIGLDFDYLDNGHVFSEYRVRDVISGGEAEAAIGISNTWKLTEGLSLNLSSEQVRSLEESEEGESLAITMGLDYSGSERWKGTGRMEVRRSETSESLLNTFGVAMKLDHSWSALLQNTLSIRRNLNTSDKLTEDRLRTGIAYRSTDTNELSGMGRYEYKIRDDETQNTMRKAHIWTTHANWHPSRSLTLSGRYAGKYVTEQGIDYRSDHTAHLMSLRAIYDVTERVDVSVMGGVITSDGFKNQNKMAGIEVGYLLTTNLWLSAGYNFFAVQDKELPDSDYSSSGAYVRLRFKFDEDAFDWLK